MALRKISGDLFLMAVELQLYLTPFPQRKSYRESESALGSDCLHADVPEPFLSAFALLVVRT
jgi:hypothetical protein